MTENIIILHKKQNPRISTLIDRINDAIYETTIQSTEDGFGLNLAEIIGTIEIVKIAILNEQLEP